MYGLSSAESDVVVLLLRGQSTREAALSLEISVNTLRTHLRRIFAKTGARSQSELVLFLAAGVAALDLSTQNKRSENHQFR